MDQQTVNAHTIATTIQNHPQKEVPLFVNDFEVLKKIVPTNPVRIINDSRGQPYIIFVNKQQTLNQLKAKFSLFTKEEAGNELREGYLECR